MVDKQHLETAYLVWHTSDHWINTSCHESLHPGPRPILRLFPTPCPMLPQNQERAPNHDPHGIGKLREDAIAHRHHDRIFAVNLGVKWPQWDDLPVNPVMDRVLDLLNKTAKEPEAVKQILPRFRSTKNLPLPCMRITMWSRLIPFHFQVMRCWNTTQAEVVG